MKSHIMLKLKIQYQLSVSVRTNCGVSKLPHFFRFCVRLNSHWMRVEAKPLISMKCHYTATSNVSVWDSYLVLKALWLKVYLGWTYKDCIDECKNIFCCYGFFSSSPDIIFCQSNTAIRENARRQQSVIMQYHTFKNGFKLKILT